ncbi:aldehyde dehydrogenase family protein, partial [Mycobacteroides abscessus]
MSVPSSWIKGRPVATHGDTRRVINPATGEAVADLKLATAADVDAAVAAARAA